MKVNLTVLSDNSAAIPDINAEHGFSIYVETSGINILFDTGASRLFYNNSTQVGIELYGADAIVLSHGHHDHGGGIDTALREAPRASLWHHKEALLPKYSDKTGKPKDIGLPRKALRAIANATEMDRIVRVSESVKMQKDSDSVILLSHGGRKKLPENWHYLRKAEDKQLELDRFSDELSLLIQGDEYSCIITGCSHNGLPEIYRDAQEYTLKPVQTIIGGCHMKNAGKDEIIQLADYFRHEDVHLYLGHCTGIDAYAELYKEIGEKLTPIHTGMQFELEI